MSAVRKGSSNGARRSNFGATQVRTAGWRNPSVYGQDRPYSRADATQKEPFFGDFSLHASTIPLRGRHHPSGSVFPGSPAAGTSERLRGEFETWSTRSWGHASLCSHRYRARSRACCTPAACALRTNTRSNSCACAFRNSACGGRVKVFFSLPIVNVLDDKLVIVRRSRAAGFCF